MTNNHYNNNIVKSYNSNSSNCDDVFVTQSSDPYNSAYNTNGYSIDNSSYSTNMHNMVYNEYRKDTEEILEMFTEATKKLSEIERELLKNKFYDLFLNKKIKIRIEINDEEKI